MILLKEHNVKELSENKRFQDYAYEIFNELIPSKKGIKKAIKRGELLLNEQITETGRYVNVGDKLQLYSSDRNIPTTYNLKLEVSYEDEYLAVINKPAGINVSGNMFRTIVNALPYNLKKSSSKDALSWFRPVHRLDNQTSGLLIVAKTQKAMVELGNMLENKIVKKVYVAIVIGKINNEGVIKKDIDNKNAITEYKVLKRVKSLRNKYLSLVELYPKTGRTHQLRIHLSGYGFPILGDKIYGKKGSVLKYKGLFLSSIGLLLKHPVKNNNLEIKIEIPYKFMALLNREQRRFDNYTILNSNSPV